MIILPDKTIRVGFSVVGVGAVLLQNIDSVENLLNVLINIKERSNSYVTNTRAIYSLKRLGVRVDI